MAALENTLQKGLCFCLDWFILFSCIYSPCKKLSNIDPAPGENEDLDKNISVPF